MKKLLCLILAALMLTTCALAYGAGTGEAVYTNRWNLASGFVYENAFSYGSTGSRNETFVVENAPGSSVYPIVLACDTIYGGMTITQMIDYAEGLGYNVVGAINADFGYWETRIPCGMVVEDGVYKSSPEGNSAIGFTNGRAYASYKPEVYITLENQTSGGSVTTTHLNKTRSDSGVYLYSEYFSTVSTRTSSSGWYVRFKVLSGEITLDGTVELEVADIITGETSVPIGEGYLILTASASRGSVSGGVYTAPASAGTDKLTLSSGTASGSGTLHVVTKADSLSVTDAESGTAITSAVLEQGETLSVEVAAKYLLRDVYMDDGSVTYSVEGSIGTVTKDGLFTATGTPGTKGKLLVNAAGITSEIEIEIEKEFTDIIGHWAESYVKALYKDGIVSGITETQFGPDLSMKRCDFVLMLYRAAGSPSVSEGAGFADVPDSAYYASAVAWAYANGITEGKGEGLFAPQDTLTRQEGFTFLYRALKTLGVSYTDADASLLSRFPDAASVASWAQTPTATLISLGIVDGSDSGLAPAGSLTRAQMAKMLQMAREM